MPFCVKRISIPHCGGAAKSCTDLWDGRLFVHPVSLHHGTNLKRLAAYPNLVPFFSPCFTAARTYTGRNWLMPYYLSSCILILTAFVLLIERNSGCWRILVICYPAPEVRESRRIRRSVLFRSAASAVSLRKATNMHVQMTMACRWSQPQDNLYMFRVCYCDRAAKGFRIVSRHCFWHGTYTYNWRYL